MPNEYTEIMQPGGSKNDIRVIRATFANLPGQNLKARLVPKLVHRTGLNQDVFGKSGAVIRGHASV